MFSIDLAWKQFNISLVDVESWLKANAGEHYDGNMAAHALTLIFTEEPDQATQQAIRDYWDDLTEESDEATNYRSIATIEAAMKAAREDAVTKSWDDLSIAQRKLLNGIRPTHEELGL